MAFCGNLMISAQLTVFYCMKVTCFCIRQMTGSLTLSVRHLYSVARQTSIAVTYAAKTINQPLNFYYYGEYDY